MPRKFAFPLFLTGAFLVLCVGVACEALSGSVAWNDPAFRDVFLTMRLPRIVCGVLTGLDLAVAGAVFQAITQNEMASPYLLGVSQGAGLAVMIVLVAAPALVPCLPLLAMLGGIASFFLVYAIAWKGGASPVRLVLAGVVYGALVGSVQMALRLLLPDIETAQSALAWLTGSLVGTAWAQVRMMAPWSLVAVVTLFALARHLDVLLLGDESARGLGARVDLLRFVLAAAAVLAAATAVSAAGLVGFVGLIVPHVVRAFSGPGHRRLLVGCLVAGPALMVASDAVARAVVSPLQLPVGVVTGTFGGVFFLFLLRSGRRRYVLGGGARG